jgi:hypothetical protein
MFFNVGIDVTAESTIKYEISIMFILCVFSCSAL